MKKILFLFAFFSVQCLVYAQFNVGVNAILQFPLADFRQMSTFSLGGSASVGYTFAQKIDLSLVYTSYGYSGPINDFSLNSKTVESKFFFLNGNA